MRAPRSGCVGANSSRIAMRPGISVSAIAISLRPKSASDRSATLKSPAGRSDRVGFSVAFMLDTPDLSERRIDDPHPAEPGRLRAPQRRARRNAPQPAWLQPVWLPYVILGGAHP